MIGSKRVEISTEPMRSFINSPFSIGSLQLENRLIQGPLAGFSCAPFRELFYQFKAPAYCVTEMISARDILHKHEPDSRYLYRSAQEKRLAYQISGNEPAIMREAAVYLESLGADLIDINCGCPKAKIRKKGAGSALLERPQHLSAMISTIRQAIQIPLTVKIRIQAKASDLELASLIEAAGADALIVHGRRWTDDYDKACDFAQIGNIKQRLKIPVIANGDIADPHSLRKAFDQSGCDAYMIARAGTGKPWLYQTLLQDKPLNLQLSDSKKWFMRHLQGLARLENDYKAVLQSKALLSYYFRSSISQEQLQRFYQLTSLDELEQMMEAF